MPQHPEYPLYVDTAYSSLTNLGVTPSVTEETTDITAERVYDATYSPKVDATTIDLEGISTSHEYPGWGHEAYWEEYGERHSYSRVEEVSVTVTITDGTSAAT